MAYIQRDGAILPGPTNFSKAVISLWFRVPAATFAVMAAIPDVSPPGQGTDMTGASLRYYPPLVKTIPLITFGSVEQDDFGPNPVQPSFVGIDCFGGHNTFCCNLQTPINGSVSTAHGSTGAGRPACFYMGGGAVAPGPDVKLTVAADTWNHGLLSFDIGHSASAEWDSLLAAGFSIPKVTSGNTFTWAFNDGAHVDNSMFPSGGPVWTSSGISDPSVIMNDWQTDAGGFSGIHDGNPETELQGDHVSWPGGYIASASNPLGIPGDVRFVSKVVNVEMARLQFFTDVTLDARDEASRRAFITSDRRPADPALGAALLGVSPLYRFDSQQDFISGNNKGTAGNFSTTGTITRFTPSP